tara:strand:+ start:1878 stop:2135 length:258 start_codon:yes stop_codon:yes gene_type:complete
MLWTNLIVGTHLIIASVIGDHIHHLIFTGIDINFGMIGHSIILTIMVGIVGTVGVGTILIDLGGTDHITHGIIGIMAHSTTQDIM